MNRIRLAAVGAAVATAGAFAVTTAPAASAATNCSGSVIASRNIVSSAHGVIGSAKLYYSGGYNCVKVFGPGNTTKTAKLWINKGNPQYHQGSPATGNFWGNNQCVKFGGSISGPGGYVGSTTSAWGHCD